MRRAAWAVAVAAGGCAAVLAGYALVGMATAATAPDPALTRPAGVGVDQVLNVLAGLVLVAAAVGLGAVVARVRGGLGPAASAAAGAVGPLAAVAGVLALFLGPSGGGAGIAAAHAGAAVAGTVAGLWAARRRG
ncbi:hypothetical protein [Nocardiopsis trehalosi]|uniref:hypothetical protein n=1 Tax=Nocardiopsis trehalosi TaxID=109329 RepID=UPI00082B3D1C|nr:hypothetical protein [Nocardiopsis trehalosi]